MADRSLQLQSLLRSSGVLEVSLVEADVPEPGPDQVVVRVEASPVNPSDLGVLFGPVDVTKLTASGTPERPVVSGPVSRGALEALAARVDRPLPVGNEGSGTVVATGSSDAARALAGKKVAALGGGGMYGQYCAVAADQVLVLDDDASFADGASAFVNPLTALGFLETMRHEGHTAIVHTAAASALGQMLHRACAQDGVGLVNVVRRPEQEALLRGLGAEHVVSSASDAFAAELVDAIASTGATLGFDATGGGKLAAQLLAAMERAITRNASGGFQRYGSNVHKQVYLYGSLDTSPTEIQRTFGLAWGIGGWLVFPRLARFGPERTAALKARVARELRTTFATHYAREVTLREMLDPGIIAEYGKRATGGKVLVLPQKD
ncbi:MAG: putative oxidoreductase [Labilithrix sp.]|nr:putative oxidoreductase [Labilithrix sp.]